MCGIAGIVDYTCPGSELIEDLEIMRERLQHRGPDGHGTTSYPTAALAHTRLALIDIEGGAQPFVSRDGRYAITYNGEIYNYRELRAELHNKWTFTSHSDTEVILAAFAIWGENCVERFNGMFAFFIWDCVERRGFGARDLLGIKPFVFSRRPTGIVFASEAKAILALPQQSAKLNQDAVLEYLVAPYFSGIEQPMFDNLEYLPPGHLLYVNENGIVIHQWKEYDLTEADIIDLSHTEEMADCLRRATTAAMTSDVPVGAYLSGGFDSTLITALASRSSRKQLKGFTICFENQDRYDYSKSLIISSDDTPFAVDAARKIGVDHTMVHVERDDLEQTLEVIAATNDALPAWEQEFAQHHLAQEASKHCKAVLVGDAADETHYGYQFLLDDYATRSPAGILQRFDLPPLRTSLIDNPLAYFDSKYCKLAENAGHCWDTPNDRYLATTYLIVKRWLPRLLHNGDIHAMNASLEARVPFGDIHLLNLARRVHPTMGYHNHTEKHFLRQSAKGLMPEASRLRKKSALPKDQMTEHLYKRIAVDTFCRSNEFLELFFEVPKLMLLCEGKRTLSEQERALLFRTISLCFWQQIYGVN